MTYILWSSDFALYFEDCLIYEHHNFGLWVSMTKFDLKINVGHGDLYFMVQWFCLIFWRLFDVWTPLFGIMSRYDLKFDLKINVGHCDLYFMVQCFWLISWRLFDIWTPYFGIMSQYEPMFDLKINVGHCELYFIVHWFCLISLYLMDECHTFGKWVSVIRSSDLSFFNFCSEKHFSFIGKARFRRATLSCDSSYFLCKSSTFTIISAKMYRWSKLN